MDVITHLKVLLHQCFDIGLNWSSSSVVRPRIPVTRTTVSLLVIAHLDYFFILEFVWIYECFSVLVFHELQGGKLHV